MKAVTFSMVLLAVIVMATASPATRVSGGSEIARCQCACMAPFNAVCARQGRNGPEETFPSKCHLECYNCTHNTEYVVVFKRACEEKNV